MTEICEMNIVSRILLISWNFISVLLSFFGNTFVLVASRHGKAIKLDRVSIVLLESLAVADIGTALFAIMPAPVWLLILNPGSSFSEYLNTLFFKIIGIPSLIFMGASISLIPVLNCCKLFSLLFPLRARTWRYRDGYKIVALVWVFFTLCSTGLWIAGQHSKIAFKATSSALNFLFILVVFISTFALLVNVQKARGLRKQGVFSIILVSVVYFVCFAPTVISNLTESINGTGIEYITITRFITINIIYISCFSNPVIYYLTLHSFKEYTNMLFRKYLRYFRCNTSVQSSGEE